MPEFQSDTKWIVHIKGKESGDFFVHFFEKSKASHFVMNLFSKIAAAEEAEHNRSNQGGDQNSIEFDYGGEY